MSQIKVPYILTCMVTGIQKSYTSVDFVKRKIDNYGGDEAAMVAGYVCKDAKRELKSFELDKLTAANVQSVITKLGGTTDASKVLAAIQSGKLFLTKKVKVRTDGKKAAGASKKGSTKVKAKAKAKAPAKSKTAKPAAKRKSRAKAKVAAPAAPAADSTPAAPAQS